MWCKMSPHEVFVEHVVDIHKVIFSDTWRNKYFSSQSAVQESGEKTAGQRIFALCRGYNLQQLQSKQE